MKNNIKLNIHYDVDGCFRDFHNAALDFFFEKYPEYKKYLLPVNQFRGWDFTEQLKPGKMNQIINDLFVKEVFWNEKNSYKIFSRAKPLITLSEWKNHLIEIWNSFPNACITFSTHQYNNATRMATTYWLQKNGFVFNNDKISILYTNDKDRFGAHFLLDDKVQTIELFNKPNNSIGVLRLNPLSNGWYEKKVKGQIPFLTANTLDDYKKIIFKQAHMLKL